MIKGCEVIKRMAAGLGVVLLAFSFSAVLPRPAAAADTCSENTVLDVVVKDPSGAFIPNARVDVYKQVTDANGDARPSAKVAGGSTDSVLGTVHLSWRNSSVASDTYAVRIQTISKDSASFWYYGQKLDCGQTATLTKTLSGILVILHDATGNLLTKTGFNVYSQIYSQSGQPLRQLKESLASPNSGVSGQVKVYLPQGSVRSLDGTISDHYTLDLSRNGRRFNYYNIQVRDGKLTTINYYISALNVKLQDPSGALYPSGTKIEVFNQTVDQDNNRQKGTKAGDFTLGSDGYGVFEAPAGIYVLSVKGKNGVYQYFWDVAIDEGRANQYTLTAEETSSSVTTACQNNSTFTLTLRNYAGDIIPGAKFELYEQNIDANGAPTAGNRVGGGTIADSGQAAVSFRPDPRELYALKVWDKRSDLGEFWFYSVTRFVCDYDRSVTKYLPALRVVLRDSRGQLLRNYNFSLYAQEYDADMHPFFQSSDLIANLKTDGGGQATVYVAPFNTYRRGQTGDYALSAKDTSGNLATFYNITIPQDKDYSFQAKFSGLSGALRDASAHPIANREIRLYALGTNGAATGQPLLKTKTDAKGYFSFEYPAGSYVLASVDDLNRENVFGRATINQGGNSTKLVTSSITFNLSNSQVSGAGNSLTLYSLASGGNNSYYRQDKAGTVKLSGGKSAVVSLAAGPYLAVYNGKDNQEFGQAFYAKNGSAYTVSFATNAKYLLSAGQTFNLSSVTAGAVAVSNADSGSGSSSGTASGLSGRLGGRILLQVEDKGQAWYVNPADSKRYYLGRPSDAFDVMRRVGLGISNQDFAALEKNPSAWRRLAGRILIKTQDSGKAYYFDPVRLKLHYLGRPSDAFNVMRSLGLGIKTGDLTQIKAGVN
ncbi:MAG: carboxypeptidase-like regulatory domain-containing protein [Patescibacteria group bacterium]